MNPERLLENNALPFAAATLVDDHRGFECALVVSKLAWQVSADGTAQIAETQRPIRLGPTYLRGGGSSLKFASDRYAEKPGTEVLMVGNAWPPADKKVPHVDVSVRVESGKNTLTKTVRAFGPRVFTKNLVSVVPGPSAALEGPLPLIYELAEGGMQPSLPNQPEAFDPVNPVGMGFRTNRDDLLGENAYQLEPVDGTAPAGFGPIARHWSGRTERFGTLDEAYYRRRHPVPPRDFDLRYNCVGHPDLWSASPLAGDEPIEIVNATPEGVWRFRLPLYAPRFDVLMDGKWTEKPTKLDTILLDVSDSRDRVVELSWRCSVRLPTRSERVEKIRVTNAIDVPRRFYDQLLGRAPAPASPAPH